MGSSAAGLPVGNHIPPNAPVENAPYYSQVYEELSRRRSAAGPRQPAAGGRLSGQQEGVVLEQRLPDGLDHPPRVDQPRLRRADRPIALDAPLA